ncbi:MAG: signal peptidase I [Planctomycetes bacterium]|nr:signal peptidase I [Planctomycetota bacterium]
MTKKTAMKYWKEWRLTLFLIVFVILPVKSSLADFNWVPTGSMKPTILEGDFVFVNKAAYGLRLPLTRVRLARWANPERGDIVICFSPDDGTRLIKRVVGLPGDRVELFDNQLFINGRAMAQSEMATGDMTYLTDRLKREYRFATEDLMGVSHSMMVRPRTGRQSRFGPVSLAKDQYFVMGDNRDNSRDSRIFGTVERSAIVGKAVGVTGSFDFKGSFLPRLGRFFTGLK